MARMTERRPHDVPVGNWVDQLIRAAQARGEFDDLPGAGKPLPDTGPLDEDWWVRQKIRSEDLPPDALLPPALLLRKEVAGLPEAVRDLPTEAAVRQAVREVNLRVAAWIRTPTGPVVPVAPADPDTVVAAWRAAREAPPSSGGTDDKAGDDDARPGAADDDARAGAADDDGALRREAPHPDGATAPRRPWWRRLLRRR
jgi:hypothetical protein